MSWQDAVERTVTGLGYELVETERSPRGLLRVFIDRVANDPAGEFITVEDCEKVTRQLQHLLEVEGCAYERLEVSSPGLDRLLKKPQDFDRFAGQEIDLTLKLAFQGRKKYRGVLESHAADASKNDVADVANVSDSTDSAGAHPLRITFSDGKIEQALDFSWEEVREARLVPVVDFKGRRFAPEADSSTMAESTVSNDEEGVHKE